MMSHIKKEKGECSKIWFSEVPLIIWNGLCQEKFGTENDYEIWLDKQIELNGNNEQRKYRINNNIP
jgi:hypothetical protein